MMKLSMEKSLNQQVQKEYGSSYLYLSMSAFFESQGFTGLAAWMRRQSREELDHALKFFDFINQHNGRVILDTISAPTSTWDSVTDVFKASLVHEEMISKSIDNLINQAIDEKDHASHHFLLEFATEQVEEENTARDIVRKLELVGDNPTGLLMLDKELGQRN